MAPYICLADILYSRILGWMLKRTTALAEGFSWCDFHFKKGVEMQVVMPEPIHPLVAVRS
jgi:hypothetical protein